MSQLSDFLQEHSIEPEQVVRESKVAETIATSDRDLYVKRAAARRAKKPYGEFGADKPSALRRGISPRILALALEGKPITRINRKKIARAIDNLLKKEVEVTVLKLFADVPSRNHKKKDDSED